jgi:hypothetical protein
VSGDTIAQWGVHNLNEAERERCGFSEIDVEIATEFYAREGHGISLAELNNEVAPRTRAP